MNARLSIALLLLAAAGCLLIPEGREDGDGVANIRPQVSITAGAASGDSTGVDYRVHFEWLGTDEDGAVVGFQYAIDDTSTSDAWTDTTRTRVQLKLRATHTGGFQTDDTLSDWHTFYVRAVDNESAVSIADSRHFNARTIAPVTTITYPPTGNGIWPYEESITIDWEGEDLESTLPDRRPAFFEYKLIRIRYIFHSDEQVVDSLLAKENLLLDPLEMGDRTRWVRASGDITSVDLQDLSHPGPESYVFCVRAIDEAGAVEPMLERGRNWFLMRVWFPYVPSLHVFGRLVGSHTFPEDGHVWEVDVPAGIPFNLCWTGRPSYGEIDYGLNIPDPYDDYYQDPDGMDGYIGWAPRDCMDSPLVFPASDDGQIHVLALRFRIPPGTPNYTWVYSIPIRVVAPTFERTALLVDDARIGYGLGIEQDVIHDDFLMRFIGRILDYAPDGLDIHNMYRPRHNIPEALSPTENEALTLEKMLRYSAILWSFNYTGGQTTGLGFHEQEPEYGSSSSPRRLLSSYLAAGGKLFLFGGRPLATLMASNGRPDLEYPKIPPQGGPGDQDFTDQGFLWNFLHVRSQIVGIDPLHCYGTPPDDHQTWRDGLVECVSQDPAYPDLHIDPSKWDTEVLTGCPQDPPPPTGGLRDYEGILYEDQYAPLFPEAGLDTLYTSVCYDWHRTPRSRWHGSVIAQRYASTAADTLEGQQQGRTILYLFQPYPFFEGPTIDAGTASINWLMTGSDY